MTPEQAVEAYDIMEQEQQSEFTLELSRSPTMAKPRPSNASMVPSLIEATTAAVLGPHEGEGRLVPPD